MEEWERANTCMFGCNCRDALNCIWARKAATRLSVQAMALGQIATHIFELAAFGLGEGLDHGVRKVSIVRE